MLIIGAETASVPTRCSRFRLMTGFDRFSRPITPLRRHPSSLPAVAACTDLEAHSVEVPADSCAVTIGRTAVTGAKPDASLSITAGSVIEGLLAQG